MLANLYSFTCFTFKQAPLKRKYEDLREIIHEIKDKIEESVEKQATSKRKYEDLRKIIEKTIENAFSHHKQDTVSDQSFLE